MGDSQSGNRALAFSMRWAIVIFLVMQSRRRAISSGAGSQPAYMFEVMALAVFSRVSKSGHAHDGGLFPVDWEGFEHGE